MDCSQLKAAYPPNHEHQYERYDGSGFPDGLAKQNIPLGSRILNVIRDYVACLDGSMTGTEMPVSAALGRLIIRKENYYDPDVTDAFIKVLTDSSTETEEELPEIENLGKRVRCLLKKTMLSPVRS